MKETEILSEFSCREKIQDILKTLGLSKNEIEIYLDLIIHKQSSAWEVSKRVGIHRSNTYDSLRKLMERGFVNEIINDTKKLFDAISPEKIKNYIKQREIELESIISGLKYIKSEDSKGAFSISQGVFAARETLQDLLNLNSSPIVAYGVSEDDIEFLGPGFLKELHKERVKKKIFMKNIFTHNLTNKINFLNKMGYTESRFLSSNSKVMTLICENNLNIIVFGKPIYTIKITDDLISQTYKEYFEFLWRQAKNFK